MKITQIRISGLKSIESSGPILLSPSINILVGPNNAGKSTIIKACYTLQSQNGTLQSIDYLRKNIRKGANRAIVNIGFDNYEAMYYNIKNKKLSKTESDSAHVLFDVATDGSSSNYLVGGNKGQVKWEIISSTEPNNFIYPFFSKRKVTSFNESFTLSNAVAVNDTLSDLYAKVDRISNPGFPANSEYRRACKSVLGLDITCSLSEGGKQAGLIVSNEESIPIVEMGEGTTNLLGLIVDLCIAKNKLFLIEELENDIHPKALKALLELIIQKSSSNQFIVSTHSNIVTRLLGCAEDAKIFSLKMVRRNRIPTSIIKEINNSATERMKILEELGYELQDFDLWKAYLILEESSAERVIRDILIPMFVPSLTNKLRTHAAQGVDDIEPRFREFLRLFVFIHQTNAYKNRAWVIADGDSAGMESIKKLKKNFKTWSDDHFMNFENDDFESYYPKRWDRKALVALTYSSKKKRREAKRLLINEVIDWALNNKVEAKREFKKSAKEVINILISIDRKLA